MTDIHELFKKDAFSSLTEKQKELIITLFEDSKKADASGIIMLVVRYIPLIELERKLSEEEKSEIIKCILDNLDCDCRKRAENIISAAKAF